jgi:hypothetical protein
MARRSAIPVLVALALSGCRGAGPYGYSASYAPTSEEEAEAKGAVEYDPVMYQREPERWRKGKSALFGVVTARAAGPGGAAYLTLSVRRLETRNLCANANDEGSCRVTVSDRDFGVVHARARLLPEDDMGGRSLSAGSLVRVVGQFGEDVDPSDGAPIVRASFYRHWPRHYFVTSADVDTMRQ